MKRIRLTPIMSTINPMLGSAQIPPADPFKELYGHPELLDDGYDDSIQGKREDLRQEYRELGFSLDPEHEDELIAEWLEDKRRHACENGHIIRR